MLAEGTEHSTDWWKCCSCHGNGGRRSFRKWDQFVLLLKITWPDGGPPPLPLPPIQPCRAAAPVSYYKMAAQSPPPTRKPWTFVVRFLFIRVKARRDTIRGPSPLFGGIYELKMAAEMRAKNIFSWAPLWRERFVLGGLFNGFFSPPLATQAECKGC